MRRTITPKMRFGTIVEGSLTGTKKFSPTGADAITNADHAHWHAYRVAHTDLLAVLVDADNVPPSRVGAVLTQVAVYGTASVKRVYGDWTRSQLSGWKQAANEHVIQPIQQFANTTGKNASDSALIIDAMDLLYPRRFSGFCIVSSDSDFTRLASRIREEGVTVYGFGERKTPEAFRNACDQFTYLDVLDEPA